jgi:hypothetical protein
MSHLQVFIHDRRAKLVHKSLKIVWMDTDILRLCVDDHRPTIEERKQGM